MVSSLTEIVLDALKAVNYHDSDNNKRLFSALQDLLKDYPREKKILMQNADDQFIGICRKAMTGDEQAEQITRAASKYLQDESGIRDDWADHFAEAFVCAFARYGGRDNEAGTTGTLEKKDKKQGVEIAAGLGENPDMCSEPISADETGTDTTEEKEPSAAEMTAETEPKPVISNEPVSAPVTKTRKKSKAVYVLIGIGVLLAIIIAIAGTSSSSDDEDYATYDDSEYADEIYDSEEFQEEGADYKEVSHFGISYMIPASWTEEHDLADEYDRYYQFGADDVFIDISEMEDLEEPDQFDASEYRDVYVESWKERNPLNEVMGEDDIGNGLTSFWYEADYTGGEDNTWIEDTESATEYWAFISLEDGSGKGVTIQISYITDDEEMAETARIIAEDIKASIKAAE